MGCDQDSILAVTPPGAVYLSAVVASGYRATGILLLLPLYALALDGGVGIAAVLLGMKGLGTMLSDIPLGMVVSRWGDKRTMLGSLLVCYLAALGLQWPPVRGC